MAQSLTNFAKIVRSFRAFARGFGHSAPASPDATACPTPKIGLALGGGFARGMAHVGILKVLEEEGIPISYIAGTSVGAVIGAGYCSGISARELAEVAALVRFKDFARWTLSRYGFASNERMVGFLNKVLKCRTFEELKTPLAVVATDFATGDAVVFRTGPLVDAVRASCAYPGMFLPVRVGNRLLIDGMLGHVVPSIPLREMGADRVIGVYLSAHWVNMNGPRHVFDVIGQCFSIAQQKMGSLWRVATDLVLEPDVKGFSYDGFDRTNELIRVGESVAREALPLIRKWLQAPVAEPAANLKAKRIVAQPATNLGR